MSNHDVEDRLSRLAPVDAPDPAGLTAARARLDDAVRSSATADGPGSPGPVTVLPPDLHEQFSPDVVVPLAPRARRHRTLLVAAASVAAVGVLALVPGHMVLEQREAAATSAVVDWCRDGATASGSDVPIDLDPVVATRIDDQQLVLLDDPTRSEVMFCAADVDPALGGGSVMFGEADEAWDAPERSRITFVAIGTMLAEQAEQAADQHDTYAITPWGHAGDDVDSVSVTTTSGRTVQALVADGYWAAFMLGTDPDTGIAQLTWHLVDGTTVSATADQLSEE